ncbi:MAG: alanine--tRNA ligase [Candidatus Rokubacteria bacterium]|nr:alanine--tRNA ligase [Candidatus Rokubacteria bacterium]MBI3827576.1 alanine--tRNA ligase [Candidatus Rokubacteria bacterium]
MTGAELRDAFLRYFERNGHARVASSPLVPAGDPTLLFTSAGMVQFKGVFLGEDRRDYVRATTCQKCVRAGGKHNDLENVGRTARHHTFFEMLGNFSFGDYFKAEAVRFAWEFLTRDLAIDQARLKATVFTDDDDAFGLWKTIAGLSDDRILRLGEKDNFWAMGDTGPCGPCSEVHFHQGDDLPCAEEAAGRACLGPACECDRWLEIWNLVFMQFNRDAQGVMTPLPRPSIDTGMGLERIAAVIQGKRSNYDTDLLAPLIRRTAELAGKAYGRDEEDDVSMRVIADHARAATFLIADGVFPSNEWRGYVLRRIMRRAMRHGRRLGLAEPFLWTTVAWVGDVMGEAYPEIGEDQARLRDTVRQEEERFAETLDAGMAKLEEYLGSPDAAARAHAEVHGERGQGRVVDGKFLFTLYDTYGFPRDLAEDVLTDKGWVVTDETEATWTAEMEAQRQRARAGAAFAADEGEPGTVGLYQRLSDEIGAVTFVGYETLTTPARVLAMVKGTERVRDAAQGDEVEVILDRTPAYAESGGQMGDTGSLIGRQGRGEIVDTYYRGSRLIVHRVRVTSGGFHENEDVAATVESPRRMGLRQHHTGTHLLHAALRRILGSHVAQAGSLVAPDHLRFDFSHGASMKDREVEQIEELVNEQVQANTAVTHTEMDLKEALAGGAMALFGEKYGERVRVVRIGDFSTELCGGTHLDATGQLGFFKVDAEGAVAAGVRRIEAVAGTAAVAAVARQERVLKQVGEILKTAPAEAPQRLRQLLEERRTLERQLEALEARLVRSRAEDLVAGARQIGGVAVVAARVDGLDADGLRAMVDTLRDRLGSGVVCVGGAVDGKVSIVAAVTKDLTKRFHAGKIVQEVARAAGGSGGGRPDLAQAGAKDASTLDAALDKVYSLVAG